MDQRIVVPELMDDPKLDHQSHDAALNGLKRINFFSCSTGVLWNEIRDQIGQISDRPVRILDVASGGGDTVIGISKKACQSNLEVSVDGCDISSHALQYAQNMAGKYSPLPNRFFQRDVQIEGLPEGYDVIMCSLFLHHLDEIGVIGLLREMARACKYCVVVDDLRRTRLGYALAWAGCRLLTRSPVVRFDGPQSVRAAFDTDEIGRMAEEAGLVHHQLRCHWPQRVLLSWRKR